MPIRLLLPFVIFCIFSIPARAGDGVGKGHFQTVELARNDAVPAGMNLLMVEPISWTAATRWQEIGKMFSADGLVFLLVGYGFVPLIRRYLIIPDYLAPLLSFVAFSFCAFVVFFVFLADADFARKFVDGLYIAAAVGLVGSALVCRLRLPAALGGRDSLCVLILIAITITAYIALLYLPRSSANVSTLAARRGTGWDLPWDNVLNETIAKKMAAGSDPRHALGNDWTTSDRPPLQTGVQLACLPMATRLGLKQSEFLYPIPGMLFQAGWICGAWGLMRAAGCSRKRSMQLCLALIPSGFLYVNTIFIWAKLSAAGFSLGALALLLPKQQKTVPVAIFAAVCAVFAMLSHGGAFFFLVPTIGLAVLPPRWPGRKPLLIAAVVALVIYSPWIWYQKGFDPPGDRLIKMHLAGIDNIDLRSPFVVIKEAYLRVGWNGAVENKKSNFNMLIDGANWPMLFNLDLASIREKRADIFFHTFRALGLLNLGWAGLLIAVWQKKWRQNWVIPTLASLVALAFWCVVMFGPKTTVIHQGPYATQLLLMIVCVALLLFVHRWVFAVVAVANACLFLIDYIPSTDSAGLDSQGSVDYLAVMLLVFAIAFGLFLAFCGRFAAQVFGDAAAE